MYTKKQILLTVLVVILGWQIGIWILYLTNCYDLTKATDRSFTGALVMIIFCITFFIMNPDKKTK